MNTPANTQVVEAADYTTVGELMRTIDAYAFDYATQGKLAPLRRIVEKDVHRALATLRAELTSQQEVAAPVGDAELQGALTLLRALCVPSMYPKLVPLLTWIGRTPSVAQVEEAVGMSAGAWDCVNPESIIAASRDQVNLAACGCGGATQWRLMETAPKDGTPLLLWFPPVGGWIAGAWRGYWSHLTEDWAIHTPYISDGRAIVATRLPWPIRWMPLPAAPKAQEGGK